MLIARVLIVAMPPVISVLMTGGWLFASTYLMITSLMAVRGVFWKLYADEDGIDLRGFRRRSCRWGEIDAVILPDASHWRAGPVIRVAGVDVELSGWRENGRHVATEILAKARAHGVTVRGREIGVRWARVALGMALVILVLAAVLWLQSRLLG